MKLYNWYSLDECKDRDKIFDKLDQFRNDGKIEYEMEDLDIFKINDLDLEESDLEFLDVLFDKNDVFPYLDHNDEGDEDGEDDGDYYDENDYKK